MNDKQPTTKQIVVFNVVLTFIVSIIGTILALSVFGPIFGIGESTSGPLLFNRAGIFDRIKNVAKEATGGSAQTQEDMVVKVVADASPAVVSIVASKDVPVVEKYYVDPFSNDPFFKQFFGNDAPMQIPQYRQNGTEKKEVSAGTGFFVSSDGLILTNKHVVADPDAEYTVLMNDGRKIPAKVLARDPIQDLAVVKVEGTNFTPLKISDSPQIKIGQTAIAIGNALGEFRNTVSIGVVSGLHRSVTASSGDGSENLQELIQTDAAINPGNSGGPLLNLRGEVIGIDAAVAQGAQNIGFAIPATNAKRAIETVKTQGRIVYPYIGIRYVVVNAELIAKEKLGKDYGAYVIGGTNEPAVAAGSPADKAGIKEKDIILQIAGERVDQDHTLASMVQKHNVGDTVALKIFRDGKEMDIKVTLEERK